MKNIKRILAVVLALTMVLGMIAGVSAASATKYYSNAVNYIESTGIGEIGNKAETKIERGEVALWIAKLDSTVTSTALWKESVLKDVVKFNDTADTDASYRAAICYCYQNGFVTGNGDGSFAPKKAITLGEMSVIVTRLMGYQNKVNLAVGNEQWQYPWIRVANNYCHAFDTTFIRETGSLDPERELSYAEVAYILATILNWGTVYSNPDDARCLTADGENLGEKFPTGSVSASSASAIITGLDFVKVTHTANTTGQTGSVSTYTYRYFGATNDYVVYRDAAGVEYIENTPAYDALTADQKAALVDTGDKTSMLQWAIDTKGYTLMDYTTNVINITGNVTFNIIGVDGKMTETATMTTADFQVLVRRSLGLSDERDWVNGEKFNLGDYVSNGSYVKLQKDSAGVITGVTLASADKGTKVVSDTFIVATAQSNRKWAYGMDGSISVIGKSPLLANGDGSNNFTPVLPTAYTASTYTDANGATQYANAISFNEKGQLVFKGASDTAVAYTVKESRTLDATEIAVYDIADLTTPLTADEADALIPNTAEGEACVEFSDMDGDGYYDIAVIRETSWFAYRDKVNADPASVDEDKRDNRGGVIVDAYYSRITSSVSTDMWDVDLSKTSGTGIGAVTLIVAASNKRNVVTEGYYRTLTECARLPYYQAVELWTMSAAYIQDVKTTNVTINGASYIEATFVNIADGSSKTVYVPVVIPTTQTVNVTIAGATTALKLNSEGWMPFLADYVAADDKGISSITDPGTTAAWLVDKCVKYATAGTVINGATGKACDIVVAMTGTESTVGQGFVVDVVKTETGDNTFNVTIAQSGVANATINWCSFLDSYVTRIGYGWRYTNWMDYTGKGYDHCDYTESVREQMTTMGFTDVDAWATSKWIGIRTFNDRWITTDNWNMRDKTGNVWAYARNIVTAANFDSAVFNMTLDEIKTAYPGVAANVDSMLLQYIEVYATQARLDAIPASADPAVTKEYLNYKAEMTKATTGYAFKFGDILDDIDGFDKDVFLANVTNNVKNVRTNTNYGYWLHVYADVCNGYLNTSKLVISAELGQRGYATSIVNCTGATSVKTYQVRASASYIWNVSNRGMYYAIFKGDAIQTTDFSTSKVTGNDLIYVSMKKDASSLYVLEYLDKTSSVYAADLLGQWATGTGELGNNGMADSAYWSKGTFVYAKGTRFEAKAWTEYTDGILLGTINTGSYTTPGDYTATLKMGYKPYYLKTGTSSSSEKFARYWTTVEQRLVNIHVEYAQGDPLTTLISVVDESGVQIKVTTEAEKTYWETRTTDGDGNPATYKVISKLLYKVNTVTPEFKYDANGNKIINVTVDYAGSILAPGTAVLHDVAIEDSEIKGLLTYKELTTSDTGYMPGAYSVTYAGKSYIALGKTPIVVMTPNFKTGDLDGKYTTLATLAAAKNNIFVSWQQLAFGGASFNMLSVIGEFTNKDAVIEDPTTEEDKTHTVYLSNSDTTIQAMETGKYYVVKSTYSASELPSGASFGSIQRKYNTYSEAAYAASVKATMEVGFYIVKDNGEIVTALGTSASAGKIINVTPENKITAEIGGKKVDATNYKWAFFYVDFEGNFCKAGTSTAVTLASYTTAQNAYKSAQTAYDSAVATYNNVVTLGMSDTIVAKYKTLMEEAATALETAKANAVAKYLNGQFWGAGTTAAYKYIVDNTYSYQQTPDPITFSYVLIDGTYCVLVDSFFN